MLFEPHHVAQHLALTVELGLFIRLQSGFFNLPFLKTPEIGEPQLFLFAAVQFLQFARHRVPTGEDTTQRRNRLGRFARRVHHRQLAIVRKQFLLIVLTVDIAQVRRQILEQRRRHRAAT